MHYNPELLPAIIAVIFVACIAWIPGSIARRRRHVNADAITACGWLGMLFGPLLIVAFIWAFTNNTHRDRD